MKVLYASSLLVLFVYLFRYIRYAYARAVPPRWVTDETVSTLSALLLTILLAFAASFAVQGVSQFTSSGAIDETIAIASVIAMLLAVIAPLVFARRRLHARAVELPSAG